MFHNNQNDYDEFHSVRSGPNQSNERRPDDASLNYSQSTFHNFDNSQYDDFSRADTGLYGDNISCAETTPYFKEQPQYDERSTADERSSYHPHHSEEGTFVRPSAPYNGDDDDDAYEADEAMDTESLNPNRSTHEDEYDTRRSNVDRYHDDPYGYDEEEDVERDALYRTDENKYKPSLEQRKQKCCNLCYVPSCEFRGPCKFPHGCCYAVLGIMSAVGGLMMNFYVLGTCLFQRVQKINFVTGDIIPGSQRGYGFFSRETDYGVEPDYRQCTWYPPDEYEDIFDGWMKTGRFFAMISAILATACFVVMFMTCCWAFSRSMFEKWLFWMYIWAAIFVAFSFFIFGNEFCQANDCKVADGCGWAISAFMFHLLAANTVKSFPMANAPNDPKRRRNKKDDEYEEAEDEDDLDDLYYENEDDKYPPFHPDGPRGVTIDKDGLRTFDDGEDYYNDMGRMVDPNAEQKRQRSEEEELEDISDHDLEQYASDHDEEDDDDPNASRTRQQRDANGNPIFDPDAIDETGNLGVGYENEEDVYSYADDRTNQPYDNQSVFNDEYSYAPSQQENDAFSQYDNATVYDEYGAPRDRKVDAEDQSVQSAPFHEAYDEQSVDAFSYADYGSEYSAGASDNATEHDETRYKTQAANIGQEQYPPSAQRRPTTIFENDDEDDEYSGPVFA